jgi:hypothetical protein
MSVTGSPPARFPSGTSTSPIGYLFGNYPFRTPFRLNEFYTDFNTYNASDWTVTAGSSGTAALIDANGGALALTTALTNNDIQGIQLVKKSFAFTANSQVWFSINVSLTHATEPAFMAGLGSSFTALTPTDGVYFSKAAGSATLNCVIRAASTSTTLTVGTMVDATNYTFGYYYDGKPLPTLSVFSTIPYAGSNTALAPTYFTGGEAIVATASSVPGATNTLANLPPGTTLLTAGASVKAGAAATYTGLAVIGFFLASEEIVARF